EQDAGLDVAAHFDALDRPRLDGHAADDRPADDQLAERLADVKAGVQVAADFQRHELTRDAEVGAGDAEVPGDLERPHVALDVQPALGDGPADDQLPDRVALAGLGGGD